MTVALILNTCNVNYIPNSLVVEVDVIRGKGVCVDNPGASSKDLFSQVIQWTEGREISGFSLQGWYRYLVCKGGRMRGNERGKERGKKRGKEREKRGGENGRRGVK